MESIEINEILEKIPETINLKGQLTSGVENKVYINDEHLPSGPSKKVWNHSPCGFSWGYLGSGCAQLALGILLVYLPVDLAKKLHQSFKRTVIATLPQNDFDVTINLKETISTIINETYETQ